MISRPSLWKNYLVFSQTSVSIKEGWHVTVSCGGGWCLQSCSCLLIKGETIPSALDKKSLNLDSICEQKLNVWMFRNFPIFVHNRNPNKFILLQTYLFSQMFSYRREQSVSNSWPQIDLIRMCKWYCLFIYSSFGRLVDGGYNFLCRLVMFNDREMEYFCIFFVIFLVVARSDTWISICYVFYYWIIECGGGNIRNWHVWIIGLIYSHNRIKSKHWYIANDQLISFRLKLRNLFQHQGIAIKKNLILCPTWSSRQTEKLKKTCRNCEVTANRTWWSIYICFIIKANLSLST